MIEIEYAAFSFLQKKLKALNQEYDNVKRQVPEDSTAVNLIEDLGLLLSDVEAIFLNGKVVPVSTILKEGDRVALLPPGTPGPYRVMLGIKNID
jgi:sulfur carrier protein ThiS